MINQSSTPISLDVEKSYRGINRYYNNKLVLSPDGMRELRTILPFNQLRFHCRKQQPGRTFHVKTAANASSEAVVAFLAVIPTFFPKLVVHLRNLRETTQSSRVDA